MITIIIIINLYIYIYIYPLTPSAPAVMRYFTTGVCPICAASLIALVQARTFNHIKRVFTYQYIWLYYVMYESESMAALPMFSGSIISARLTECPRSLF